MQLTKKSESKKRRCLAIIKADSDVDCSEVPTNYLAILNAGLSNGLSEEKLITEASQYGQISQVLMLPAKSYCFLECVSIADSEKIYLGMHNSATIGQKGAIAYLSYMKFLPSVTENIWKKALPNGLLLLPDFIDEQEEMEILETMKMDDNGSDGNLKYRRVKHYGFEFLYGTNNVDVDRPLEQKIPSACDFLWPRLESSLEAHVRDTLEWIRPDQLTVNIYESGQGIPPHVDTHSAFLDPIMSLSLQSDIVMDFRNGKNRIPVLLPRRSLLIMSGESRFDWTHGITPKHIDVVPTPKGSLTTQSRGQRTSLTFRRLRRGPCDCNFSTLCDTKQAMAPKLLEKQLAEQAVSLEQQNVHEVYDKIANHFSDTRHSPWPQVRDFLNSFDAQSIVLDVGCGNGKYLSCNQELLTIGCDRSEGLIQVCVDRGQSVFRCDCLNLPIRTGSIDGCISIAVIHHLATADRRLAAIREMARVLSPGGRALIYVWAKDQRCNNKKSSYLRQNKAVQKDHITEEEQRQNDAQQLQNIDQCQQLPVSLPVHTNRTEFQQQDVFVPWKTKDEQKTTFMRYYHVFEANELEELVAKLAEDVSLLHSYYDQGNHCVIIKRVSHS